MRLRITIIVVLLLVMLSYFPINNYIEATRSKVVIPVLMYHHFVEPGEETSWTTITNEAFEEQMQYLKANGYNTITDQDLVDFYYGKKRLPKKPIHITIDDGYKSNYQWAYPILKKNDMKATIFIISSRIEDGNEHYIPRLTWEQLKEMSDEGVMSIQSHTHNLHHKETINGEEISAAIADHSEEHYQKVIADFILSKEIIENKLGKEAVSLSYPYGHFDENTSLAVEEAGFKFAYTIKEDLNEFTTNPFELYRINVPSGWTGESIEKEIEKQTELLKEK